MNNRQEFLEKLEKFKYENPNTLFGGVVSELNDDIIQRPAGSTKRSSSTEASACNNSDTWYDKDLYNCEGKDGDCEVDSRSDMDCGGPLVDNGGGFNPISVA
jgi:hypothetical protein